MMEGVDQTFGWAGPVGEMIKAAVIAGAYRRAIRRDPARGKAFGKLADGHSARVAALASGIAEAGDLLQEIGLTTQPA